MSDLATKFAMREFWSTRRSWFCISMSEWMTWNSQRAGHVPLDLERLNRLPWNGITDFFPNVRTRSEILSTRHSPVCSASEIEIGNEIIGIGNWISQGRIFETVRPMQINGAMRCWKSQRTEIEDEGPRSWRKHALVLPMLKARCDSSRRFGTVAMRCTAWLIYDMNPCWTNDPESQHRDHSRIYWRHSKCNWN